jgi:hypothetical protein
VQTDPSASVEDHSDRRSVSIRLVIQLSATSVMTSSLDIMLVVDIH